ncbi:hypothetical protein STENM223S_11798 [Streptomyces tendae]
MRCAELVNLLSTRLQSRDEALNLLDEHRHLFVTDAERRNWSQQRSTILEHAGKWAEALDELRGMLSRGPTGDERVRLVIRTTMALLRLPTAGGEGAAGVRAPARSAAAVPAHDP